MLKMEKNAMRQCIQIPYDFVLLMSTQVIVFSVITIMYTFVVV